MKSLAAMTVCRCRVRSRDGAVGLMLVLILTLLVGTFALSVSRRASNERRNEYHHQTIAVLQSAIDAVAETDFGSDAKIRLPLDTVSKRWVIVEAVIQPNAKLYYQATLYHNDQSGLSIRRPAGRDP